MGIKVWTCSVYGEQSKIDVRNPDPARFKILNVVYIGNNVVTKIKYLDCTNYEGVKILIYKDIDMTSILSARNLDPHFSETGVSPFARFEPTEDGWNTACIVANLLKN